MTHEQAAYFRLLLLLGFPEPLDAFFDAALEEEDPLSDVILSLVDCRGNRNSQLVVLHEYTQAAQVDYAAVGRYVLDFACSKKDGGWSVEKVVDFLCRADLTVQCYHELWWSEELCFAQYSDEGTGWLSRAEFSRLYYRLQRDEPIFSAEVPCGEEPWCSMGEWYTLYDDIERGLISEEAFTERLERFLRNGDSIFMEWETAPKQESFWQKLRKWWKR